MNEESRRRTAVEIFEGVTQSANEELKRTPAALGFSGLAGGLSMGLSALGVALLRSRLGKGSAAELLSDLLYPVGFVTVLVGRAQLFTENTLYPVVLVLDERGHLRQTLRLWLMVFVSNVVGALGFALLVQKTAGLGEPVRQGLVELGVQAAAHGPSRIFWSGVIAGWLIALVAWTVTASHWTIGQVAMTWILTFLVGVGDFAHCIAGSAEVLSAVVAGAVPTSRYLLWLLLATGGNIIGGVFMVSLLNYGQVRGKVIPGENGGA